MSALLDPNPGRPAARRELAGFLRARRARLTPQDVGIAPGVRRRTAGLRREEVAVLAGVGVTWYTWLEQGRPINASVQVLDAVARTLRLNRAEREHLYRLADVPALPAEPGLAQLSPAVLDILTSLEPMPAMLTNARYDILASNRGYDHLVHGLHSVPCEARNVLWCCFRDPNIRDAFRNFDEVAPLLVATLRASFAGHLNEPAWVDFIHRLSAHSAEFTQLWERHDVAVPGPRRKHFEHPVVGEVRFVVTSLAVSDMPEHRIMVYTPQDDQTRAKLPLPRP
jgi:transcriptional regulator with XRE-family HTH domain